MSEEPENLVLIYLRRIDQRQERMEETLGDHGRRLSRIEAELGRLIRDRGDDVEERAHLQAKLDRLRDEVERIKRRLDITEG